MIMCHVKIHDYDEVISPCEMLLTQAEMSFLTMKKDFENPFNGNCMLLGSFSTQCIFGKHEKNLLTNFHKAEEPLKIKYNGVEREADIIANFGSFQVWYDDELIVNTLSLQAVKVKYRVTYDSENGRTFCIHTNHGVMVGS